MTGRRTTSKATNTKTRVMPSPRTTPRIDNTDTENEVLPRKQLQAPVPGSESGRPLLVATKTTATRRDTRFGASIAGFASIRPEIYEIVADPSPLSASRPSTSPSSSSSSSPSPSSIPVSSSLMVTKDTEPICPEESNRASTSNGLGSELEDSNEGWIAVGGSRPKKNKKKKEVSRSPFISISGSSSSSSSSSSPSLSSVPFPVPSSIPVSSSLMAKKGDELLYSELYGLINNMTAGEEIPEFLTEWFHWDELSHHNIPDATVNVGYGRRAEAVTGYTVDSTRCTASIHLVMKYQSSEVRPCATILLNGNGFEVTDAMLEGATKVKHDHLPGDWLLIPRKNMPHIGRFSRLIFTKALGKHEIKIRFLQREDRRGKAKLDITAYSALGSIIISFHLESRRSDYKPYKWVLRQSESSQKMYRCQM